MLRFCTVVHMACKPWWLLQALVDENAISARPCWSHADHDIPGLCRPFSPWEGCSICWRDEDHKRILLCDRCDAEFHIYCLQPPLLHVPSSTPPGSPWHTLDRLMFQATSRVVPGQAHLLPQAR